MAIYMLRHRSIGKSTHPPGRASSHIRYIARRSANPLVLANEMPTDQAKARNWITEQERKGRKNARVADTIMVALPIELTTEQRLQLLRQFLKNITGNKVPWFAAIHQSGKDQTNPHAHILVHDKSPIDGRRVLLMSERGSTNRIRKQWAEDVNLALELANLNARVEHRARWRLQKERANPASHAIFECSPVIM